MVEPGKRLLETVTVVRSQAMATATGATALVLTTLEVGPIAFVVTLETIEIIRADLRKAEAMLSQPRGTA
jgi:hypothetical protein